jgi:hypothetical protein
VPRTYVHGGDVTVTAGDDPAASSPVPSHRELLDLLDVARRYVDADGVSDAAFRAGVRDVLARLDREAAAAAGRRAVTALPGRYAGLRAALTWQPGGAVVSLGVEVVGPGGDAVPGAGGPVVDLDWAATNDLARAAVTARDGAWGVPVRAQAYP